VVFVQAGRTFFKSDQTGRSENSRLAHSAAEGFAEDAGAIDGCARAHENRTDGSAQALREAEVDGVETASEIGDADVEGDGGVEDAGAIEVGGKAVRCGSLPDFFVGGERGYGATGHIVRVLQADETGGGMVIKFGRDGAADLLPGEDAALGGDGARQAAGESGHHRHLPIEYVGAGFADDLLSVLSVEADGNLVAHSAGWNEDGGFPAEDFRGARFETVDGWVFPVDVVAHFC